MRQENIDIAEKLNITPKMVQYMRPRLLSAVYNNDTAKLMASVQKHLDNAKKQGALMPKSIERRMVNAQRFPQHKDSHTRKAEATKFALQQLTTTVPMYESMVAFLQTITPEQLQILVS